MKPLLIALCASVLLMSCSKEKKFAKRLDGTWNVEKMVLSAVDTSGLSFTATNIGTIEFDKAGTGKNNFTYSYEFNGANYDVNDSESFKWENTESTVTIVGNANSGEKEIIWNVDDNEKDTQVWSRTDMDDNDWEMTLTRL